MQDDTRSREQLIAELRDLRLRVAPPGPALRAAIDIINASPVVVFVWRNEEGWPVELVSDNVDRIFGHTAEDFTSGRVRYAQTVHPEDLDRVAEEVTRFSGDPRLTHFAHEEYRIVSRNGRIRWVDDRTVIVRNADGRITHYQGIVLDVTDRKHAEEQLRQSREQYRRVYDTAPLAFVVWNRDCNITDWNERAEMLFGWSRNEVLGRNFFEFLVPETERPNVGEVVESLLHGDLPSRSVNTNLTKDGDLVTCEWNNARLRDEHGEVLGAISLALDITDRVRAEEARRRLEQQVNRAQKLESLSVLAGGIAHDFNNLLVGILGNAELALMDLPPESPVQTNIRDIEKAASRAADLARQMLAYSGKGRFVVDVLDLTLVVEEIAHLLEVSLARDVILRLDLSPESPRVRADATQIRQILMNLITNASDAIGEREGVITVRTGILDCSREDLQRTYIDDDLPEGRYCHLEVSDTGCGIEENVRSRIFEPFFTTKFTGRGLGLAGVLGIVRGHGGAIRVRSEPGEGTTFTILLPAVETADPGGPGPRGEPLTWSGAGTVLLVDDEEMVLAVARGMLRHLGFSVVSARNGDQALKIFTQKPQEFDLVLLDLTMPGIKSEECCRRIRQVRSRIPVVLSSGYSEQELSSRFASDEFSGFIQKPYLLDSLSRVLREALGNRRD